MKRALVLLITIFVLFSQETLSQGDFQDGFIVTLENDTIYGQVEYRPGIKNYVSCDFKKDGVISVYLPGQLTGYGYSNYEHFTSSIIEDSFVEVLVDGALSLYKFESIYLMKKANEIHRIDKKIIKVLDGENVLQKEDNRWRGIISFLISDCLSNPNRIVSDLKCYEKDLFKLVIQYNKCKGSDFTVVNKMRRKLRIKLDFGATIGFTQSTLNFHAEFPIPWAHLKESYNSIDPIVGLIIEVSLPRYSNRIAFQTGLQYFKSSYYGLVEWKSYPTGIPDEFYDTFIDLETLSIPISLKYSIPKRKYSYFAQVGLRYNYNIYANTLVISESFSRRIVTTLEEPAFNFTNYQIGYCGSMGIIRSFSYFKAGAMLNYSLITSLAKSRSLENKNNMITLSIIILK